MLKEYDGQRVKLYRWGLRGIVGEPVSISAAELLAERKLYRGSVIERLPEWPWHNKICDPLMSTMWKLECAKGAINIAVPSVFEDRLASTTYVDLFVQPRIVKVEKR